MEVKEVLKMSLNESRDYLADALDGLTQEEIAWSPAPHCNSLAFILWHVTRAEDIWVSRIINNKQEVYEAEGWRERLGTAAGESGYRYTEEQLRAWPVPKLADLRGYARAVHERTMTLLDSLTPERLLDVPRPDRPDETTGMILAHLITEIALHVGQIDYLRGVHQGLDTPHGGHWR